MRKYFISNNCNHTLLKTQAPFYYDDYLKYFNKLKQQPLLSQWPQRDRQSFSHWIIQALAIKQNLESMPVLESQRYLDCLRAQFFQ